MRWDRILSEREQIAIIVPAGCKSTQDRENHHRENEPDKEGQRMTVPLANVRVESEPNS